MISSLWFYFHILLFHVLLIRTVLTINKSSAFQEKSVHRRGMCWSTGRTSNFNKTLALEKIPSCTCTDDFRSDLPCNRGKTTVGVQESK